MFHLLGDQPRSITLDSAPRVALIFVRCINYTICRCAPLVTLTFVKFKALSRVEHATERALDVDVG